MVWKLKTFYNTLTEMWEPWSYAFWGMASEESAACANNCRISP